VVSPSYPSRTSPGSSVTKSAPNAFEGVQAPGCTRPAKTRITLSTAETAELAPALIRSKLPDPVPILKSYL